MYVHVNDHPGTHKHSKPSSSFEMVANSYIKFLLMLMLYVKVNTFSAMSGRGPDKAVTCSRTIYETSPVMLKPGTPRPQAEHSTTEPLHS